MSVNEPSHEKTNNVVSKNDWHKPSCTSTEDGYRLEILGFKSRSVARIKALISFEGTVKLVCAFFFCICKMLVFS